MMDVWVVCQLLTGEREGDIDVNGVYGTLEAALAACVDDRTHAARFTLNKDYRNIFDFDIVTRSNPVPTLSRSGEPSE